MRIESGDEFIEIEFECDYFKKDDYVEIYLDFELEEVGWGMVSYHFFQ